MGKAWTTSMKQSSGLHMTSMGKARYGTSLLAQQIEETISAFLSAAISGFFWFFSNVSSKVILGTLKPVPSSLCTQTSPFQT